MRKLIDPKTNSETVIPEASGMHAKHVEGKRKPAFRDICEDDDGYHPYADGPERDIDHEEDPWR